MSLFTMGKRVKEAQSSEEPKTKVAKLAKDAQESKKKGRTLGAKNYNRELLLSIINTWKPSSSVVWETVTEQYHKKSEEDKLRDPQEVKKYFITKMCNNGIKPTGQSALEKFISDYQSVYAKILDLEGAANYGDNDEDDKDSDEIENESLCDDNEDVQTDDDLTIIENESNALKPIIKVKQEFSISNKTKNIKHSHENPRHGAAKSLSKLVDTLVESNKPSTNNELVILLSSFERTIQQEREDKAIEREENLRRQEQDRKRDDDRFILQMQQQSQMTMMMFSALNGNKGQNKDKEN